LACNCVHVGVRRLRTDSGEVVYSQGPRLLLALR